MVTAPQRIRLSFDIVACSRQLLVSQEIADREGVQPYLTAVGSDGVPEIA